MPEYQYQCAACGHRFTARQGMSEPSLEGCPECGGKVERLITGGGGFIMKGESAKGRQGGGCQLESTGRTCCGRDSRCGQSRCGD